MWVFNPFTFTLPPTLINSALPRISHPVASLTVLIRMRGVLLIAPLTPCFTSIANFSPLRAGTSRKSNETSSAPEAQGHRVLSLILLAPALYRPRPRACTPSRKLTKDVVLHLSFRVFVLSRGDYCPRNRGSISLLLPQADGAKVYATHNDAI